MIQLATTTAYNLKEASEILHMNIQTIRKHIKNGKIKAQKVGNSYYVTDKTLTEYIAGTYEGKDKV